MTTGFELAVKTIDKKYIDGEVKNTFTSRVLTAAEAALGTLGCRLSTEEIAVKIQIRNIDQTIQAQEAGANV